MEFNNCFGCPKKWNVFLKLCMWWGGGLTRFDKRKKKKESYHNEIIYHWNS